MSRGAGALAACCTPWNAFQRFSVFIDELAGVDSAIPEPQGNLLNVAETLKFDVLRLAH